MTVKSKENEYFLGFALYMGVSGEGSLSLLGEVTSSTQEVKTSLDELLS